MTDIFTRRQENFVLWAPGVTEAPSLVIATLSPGNPFTLQNERTSPLSLAVEPDLWQVRAESLNLEDGIYHYWFKITDTSFSKHGAMLVTDPLAYTIDYRATRSPQYQPAAVIKLAGGKLIPCDVSGANIPKSDNPALSKLPFNNQLVIYELPTSWSRAAVYGLEIDVGSFRDIHALVDFKTPAANIASMPEVNAADHLIQLGINALELLPPADSKVSREWGYATAHYFAPDYDLGYPGIYQTSQASTDFIALVNALHQKGIKFIIDNVMAFGHDPYVHIAYKQFHIRPDQEKSNPDAYQSSRNNELRDRYGGESWRYMNTINTYNPESGRAEELRPTWAFHRAHLQRWMSKFHVDGLRLDSVNNIANWDFIRTFKNDARNHFQERYSDAPAEENRDARFLVIAEELAVPLDMLSTGTVDALWNEQFQGLLRSSILGEGDPGTFESNVRKMIDCRQLGFTDGAQAVNYITSHDTEGFRKERLFNFLKNNSIHEKEQRAKLAFVCLLTAVGIPMVFAGEEFVDEMDMEAKHPFKQVDPVNFGRKSDPWRSRVFDYNALLISFRKRSPALGVNDTNFIHTDFSYGRRIIAWVRGDPAKHDPVVVVANFSDQYTPGTEYVVRNWPNTPEGKQWKEVTQERSVPAEWVGREPLMPWEAKVYEMF